MFYLALGDWVRRAGSRRGPSCRRKGLQGLQHGLQHLFGGERIGLDIKVTVLLGMPKSTALLQVLVLQPVQRLTLVAGGEGSVQKDQEVRHAEHLPHIRDVGVLLHDLAGTIALSVEPRRQGGLAGYAWTHDGDLGPSPQAGPGRGRGRPPHRAIRRDNRRTSSPCRFRMTATSTVISSDGRPSSSSTARCSRSSAQRAGSGAADCCRSRRLPTTSRPEPLRSPACSRPSVKITTPSPGSNWISEMSGRMPRREPMEELGPSDGRMSSPRITSTGAGLLRVRNRVWLCRSMERMLRVARTLPDR